MEGSNIWTAAFPFMFLRIRKAVFSAPHGGGAAFDVGIYCLAFSLSMTGQLPDSCRSKVYVGETGVDEIGVHDGKGSIADAKSILGLMSLDYTHPVMLVSENEKELQRVYEAIS